MARTSLIRWINFDNFSNNNETPAASLISEIRELRNRIKELEKENAELKNKKEG